MKAGLGAILGLMMEVIVDIIVASTVDLLVIGSCGQGGEHQSTFANGRGGFGLGVSVARISEFIFAFFAQGRMTLHKSCVCSRLQ